MNSTPGMIVSEWLTEYNRSQGGSGLPAIRRIVAPRMRCLPLPGSNAVRGGVRQTAGPTHLHLIMKGRLASHNIEGRRLP